MTGILTYVSENASAVQPIIRPSTDRAERLVQLERDIADKQLEIDAAQLELDEAQTAVDEKSEELADRELELEQLEDARDAIESGDDDLADDPVVELIRHLRDHSSEPGETARALLAQLRSKQS
jgi:hypothetical protein